MFCFKSVIVKNMLDPPAVTWRCTVKQCSYKFVKIQRKTPVSNLFFKKVTGLRLRHKCFPVNFAKFLRTPFSTGHLRWLLLWVFNILEYSIHASPEVFYKTEDTDYTFIYKNYKAENVLNKNCKKLLGI